MLCCYCVLSLASYIPSFVPLSFSLNAFVRLFVCLLVRFFSGGRHLPVATYSFIDKTRRIHDTCAATLSFGILATLAGWAMVWNLIGHVYDASKEWLLVAGATGVTSTLWSIALLAYGFGFPIFIGASELEFGYSFWLCVTSASMWFLPIVAWCLLRIYQRLRETTREEREMSLPTLASCLSCLVAVIAVSGEAWIATSSGATDRDNHLGLMYGRYGGVWIKYHQMASISRTLTAAGVATLILDLCAMAIQLPAIVVGMRYVFGAHEVCRGQMPLVNTALTASTFFLELFGVIAYRVIVPLDELGDGSFAMAESWYLQIVATCFTLVSCIGFGYLAKPPLPGERNQLAEAIR